MTDEFLLGVWTYRSFRNLPQPVDDFNRLFFGQGELVFEPSLEPGVLRGQLALRSTPPKPKDPRLRLTGSVQLGYPFATRFQGVGVKDTEAEGWVYDYVGYFVPKWPHGVGQRPALVGSVIRTVPHSDGQGGTIPAGGVASFIAVERDFLEPREAIPLPDPVRDLLASRRHRLHHAVWHSTRNFWLVLSEEQRRQIRKLGWQPGGKEERPALGNGVPLVRNGSGEDFLFMHRQMIDRVTAELKKLGLPPIRPWNTIPPPGPLVVEPDFSPPDPVLPPPGNPDGFAVPAAWADPVADVISRRFATLKTDGFYWSRLRTWDREFKNPVYLSTLTLGELGSLLEFTVHNDLHLRWASLPRDPETGFPDPMGRAPEDIRPRWDHPVYDFLGEFYSSHVNPVFWRLHGWVDARIEDWFNAHQAVHPGEVVRAQVQGISWFKKGKWVHTAEPWASPPHHHHAAEHGGEHDHLDVKTLEKVNAVIFGPSPGAPLTEGLPAPVLEVDTAWRRLTWF